MATEQRFRYQLIETEWIERFLKEGLIKKTENENLFEWIEPDKDGCISRLYIIDDDGKPVGNPPAEVLALPPPAPLPECLKREPEPRPEPYNFANEFEERLFWTLKYEIEEMDRSPPMEFDFWRLGEGPRIPEHEPPYMADVRKRVQKANPKAWGWELGKLIYEETKKHVWAEAMANQQITAAPVNVGQNDRREPPIKQGVSNSNTTIAPSEVIVIEDSPVEAHAAPALATQFPPSAPKNSQDLAVQSQLALEEQHRQQQVKAASRPPSQTTQRASQALQRPLPAARAATPKNAAAAMRHVAATTPHAPQKVMKNVAQNIARPQSRSSAPAVGAASARAYRGQARGVPQALQGSQSIDPKRFEQMRQMYAQQQPRPTQAQMPVLPATPAAMPRVSQEGRQYISQTPAAPAATPAMPSQPQPQRQHIRHQQSQSVSGAQTYINPQDLLRAPQQQNTPQVPRHVNINPSVALQKIEASRQSQVVGEQQTPVRKRSAAEMEQQTPPKRHKTSSTGWQTPGVALQKIEASRQLRLAGEQQTPTLPPERLQMPNGSQTSMMQQQMPMTQEQMVARQQAMMQRQMQQEAMLRKMQAAQQTPMMQNQMPITQEQMMVHQHAIMQRRMQQQAMRRNMQAAQQTPMMQQRQTPAMPQQVQNGQQRLMTAQEREAYRQMMIRGNISQQQQQQQQQQNRRQHQQQYQQLPRPIYQPQPQPPQMSGDEILNQLFPGLK